MSKQAPSLEWEVAESDADWERQQRPSLSDREPGAHRHRPLQRCLWVVAALLLLLMGTGDRWWRSTQAESPPAVAALPTTAPQELQAVAQGEKQAATSSGGAQSLMDWWYQRVQADHGLHTAVQSADPAAPLEVELQTVAVQGDQVVARVVTTAKNGMPAYRQTRFYRRTASGWQQTAPDVTRWGPERSLETPSFIFRFRQNDAQAVIAVAPQIEALSTTLRHNFGLPIPFGVEKLVIEVSVIQNPGHPSWLLTPDRFLVASPAVYWAPVELTDEQLLAQSLVLPLLAYGLAQASERDQIGLAWQPLLDGLRLWQVWDLDLPLAVWREDVVKWIYVDLPTTTPEQPLVLSERFTALCAAHKLWMLSPAQLNIPLACALDGEDWHLLPEDARAPLTHLAQLTVPAPPDIDQVNDPSQTVALATLIEYAVATYGRDRLPALVAGLGQYESWDTLLPAVFGVSAAEFEAGWQAYLAARYSALSSSRVDTWSLVSVRGQASPSPP